MTPTPAEAPKPVPCRAVMRLRGLCVLAGLMQLWVAMTPALARGASVDGTIRVIHPVVVPRQPVTMYPRRGLEGAHPHKSVVHDTGPNCVVYLEGIAPDPAPAVPDTFSMRQLDEQFIPHVLPVRAGSVVRFPNLDPFFHNVFSYSKPKRFDLGKYPTGRSRSVRFASPGVIQVFCELHEFMSAYIMVFPHSYFASPSPDGHFVIANVPPGRYRLTVWRPGGAETSHSLTVSAEDKVVHADIDL